MDLLSNLLEFASVLTFIYLFSAVLLFLSIIFLLLWISVNADIVEFVDSVSDVMAIILVPIFIVQTWIFYHQYRHMKEPEKERIPPVWVSAKDNSGEHYSISLNNGGDVPVFNIEHITSAVSVKDRLLLPKIKFEGFNKDHLQRVDAKSEKVIFEAPSEEFQEMRLFVVLDAKSIGGYSMRLFFYKPLDALDFDLVKVKYVR